MKSVLLNGSPTTPSKIVCVGRNYTEHIEELDTFDCVTTLGCQYFKVPLQG